MNFQIKILAAHTFLRYFTAFSSFAILYFIQITDSYSAGMAVFAVREISTAFLEIPTGILSDRIGRKNTIFLGSISMFLSLLIYSCAIFYWPL